MEMTELTSWIKKEDERLRAKHSTEDDEKRTYTRTIKLVEEVGELCSEVMIYHGQSREEKSKGHNHESIEKEFADVLITTMLLANHLQVDVGEALAKKIKIIDQRNSKKRGQL